MSKIWFTGDTHFGHLNILKFTDRGDSSITAHDSRLIEQWNKQVGAADIVYHLGDFCWGDPKQYLERLSGQIHLIWGNHDRKKILTEIREDKKSRLVWVGDNKTVHKAGHSERFYLSHYAHRTWPSSHRGVYHLYGHSHGMIPDYYRSMDVGIDTSGGELYSTEQIINRLSSFSPVDHHPEMVE